MDEINQIKQNINIVDLIGTYIELKKSGKNYKGKCPFHGEKTPSFMVSPDLQIYKCFGCGESGDIFTFVQEIEGLEFPQALEQLAEKAGVKIEKRNINPQSKEKQKIYEINETTASIYHNILMKSKHGEQAKDYFINKRKLSEKTIKEFNLGVAPKGWDTLYQLLKKRGFSDSDLEQAGVVIKKRSGTGYIDKFRERVIIPLTGIDGRTVGFMGRVLNKDAQPKYLNTQETLIFKKNSYLYGLDKAKIEIKQSGAVFVEGNMDVIMAHQEGIKNVVATSGTSLTTNQLKMLKRYTNDLIFCFDSDTAGQNATLRAIELAEDEEFNIKVALIPEGTSDLDELLQKDKQKANNIIKEAISIYDFFVANSLETNDKRTSLGKKKIIEDLAPKLAKIKSDVVANHYQKQISDILDIDEEVINNIIVEAKKGNLNKQNEYLEKSIKSVDFTPEKTNLHVYILSLLLKAELAIAQNILYKLGKSDFPDESIEQSIFIKLKEYLIDRKKKFEIKHFIGKLNSEEIELVQSLHLKDLGAIATNEEKFEKELQTTFKRLKHLNLDKKLNKVEQEIKEAEKINDSKRITKLTEEANKLLKQKKQYG